MAQTLVRDKKTGRFVKMNEFDWALHSMSGTWTKQQSPPVKIRVKQETPKVVFSRIKFVLACGLAAYLGARLGLGL